LSAARLHVVTGKGGTGKTTVAAALAIDAEAALLEYFEMFYRLGMAGHALKRMGAVEFATTLAPGLRDVLLTGKAKECVNRKGPDGRPLYDAVVIDAPPTGRVVSFLDVTKAMADLAKSGPVHSQAEGVVEVLHSPLTAVHVVTLLEELPVTETLETVDDLVAAGLRPGAVIANQVRPQWLPDRSVVAAAGGRVDATRIRGGLASAGLDLTPDVIDGLVAETVEHAQRVHGEAVALARLDDSAVHLARLELPRLIGGVDLGSLYELADLFHAQGVGA